ncbi:hypothetical protein HK101_006924 [Irineochytrium annulatum]|nr:hypothetical protein HK101_006924 [Irineochytrium annulatum]
MPTINTVPRADSKLVLTPPGSTSPTHIRRRNVPAGAGGKHHHHDDGGRKGRRSRRSGSEDDDEVDRRTDEVPKPLFSSDALKKEGMGLSSWGSGALVWNAALGLVTAMAVATRSYGIDQPNQVVFDEVK